MPIYSIMCSECGHRDTMFRKIANMYDVPEHCGKPMIRLIDAPAVQTDIPPYQSPIDGRWIDSKTARREDLKRSGCRPWEGMESEKKEAQRRAEYIDTKYNEGLEGAIMHTFNNMSAEKQRTLTQEL